MRKILILGVILIFLTVGFSGCTETKGITTGQVSGQDKFELSSYSIESWTWMDEKVSDGFNNAENVDYYKISGNIKNKEDQIVNVKIIMKFYDKENKLLGSEEMNLHNIANSATMSFSKNINKHFSRYAGYWEEIEKITFSLS